MKFLLDYLIQNGTVSTYESFVDSLAKDYRWLYEKLIGNYEPIMDDSFEDSLSKGDVPRLPDHHVRRTTIVSTFFTVSLAKPTAIHTKINLLLLFDLELSASISSLLL